MISIEKTFDDYCYMCEFRCRKFYEEPCYECLYSLANGDSSKSVNFKREGEIKNENHEQHESFR